MERENGKIKKEKGGRRMSVEQRILRWILIQRMEGQERYSRRLGIENVSLYRGNRYKNGDQRNGSLQGE